MSAKIGVMKSWFLAARPRTLPVSLSPILVAAGLAQKTMHNLDWGLVLFAVLFSFAIQIGTNLINDAYDFKKGADREGRGSFKAIQQGLLTFKEVYAAGCIFFILALFFGLPLVLQGGLPLLFILIASIACGYLYTGGPYPLAYLGVSDFFILFFFGWISTGAVYYLQTGFVNWVIFLAGTQVGLLAIVPNAINNLRDHQSDAKVNKKTLAVRFGPTFARWEITSFSFLPFILGIFWLKEGFLWMFVFPFICFPMILQNVRNIWINEPSPIFNGFLAKSAQCGLIFALLLAIGTLF